MCCRFLKNKKRGGISWVLVLVLVVVGGLGWVGMRYWGKGAEERAEIEIDQYLVVRKSFDVVAIAEGELEANDEVEIKNQVEGRSRISYVIDQGSMVSKGDVLVRLSDDEIKKNIQAGELDVVRIKADLKAALLNQKISESETKSEEGKGRLRVELSRLDLDKWSKGLVVQKRADLRVELSKAEKTYLHRQKQLKNGKQLFNEKFISEKELYDDTLAFTDAQSNLEKRKRDVAVYEKYTYPKERKQFHSDVEQAEAELMRTLEKNRHRLSQKRAVVTNHQRSLAINLERLNNYKEQLQYTVILAPRDGLVVYASSGRRGRDRDSIRRGREVYFNQSIIFLPNITQMTAVLKVHEAMIGQVKAGQGVNIVIGAISDVSISGVVREIATMASRTSWINPNLREYEVKVTLPVLKNQKLKPAMRCHGQIRLGRVEKAIAVPVHAVHSLGRVKVCYVRVAGGKFEARLLELGRRSETYVEVLSGLKENETVSLSKPSLGLIINGDEFEDVKEDKSKGQKDQPSGGAGGKGRGASAGGRH